jgi:CDP-glucose 4,6-dehydratase
VLGEINPEFWRGRRVLLTGHTGFKGSWISLWLQSLGATLRGVALEPPRELSLFSIARVAEGMDHHICDIRELANLKAQVDEFQPEIIIHMAAQSLVRLSYTSPVETYATNVMGTVHVLESARYVESVRAVVNVTSDKCYENREWLWGYREDDSFGGNDPYSNSKGCSELISSAYRRSFLASRGVAVATARAGNVVGGGDWSKDRLVPDILRALDRRETVTIRSPLAVRPWQHVLEPLSGYLLLAESLCLNGQTDAEGWNFGPGDGAERPVQWITEYLCTIWGGQATWRIQSSMDLHEAAVLRLDASKAHQRLRWGPKWPLEKALQRVVDWHHAWLRSEDMRALCLSQIKEYELS